MADRVIDVKERNRDRWRVAGLAAVLECTNCGAASVAFDDSDACCWLCADCGAAWAEDGLSRVPTPDREEDQ